ncbi:deoxyribose-phosphate aldolase [Brevibacterium salitolerans]|uniref:Deoxyribose-phosphate aldolase n=1 Tax=Brevibacterium salitolerans TaxID=1403566 RepID=A0ABN2WZE0_9MICO
MTVTSAELAARVDHTLLKPESSAADFAAHVASARELGVLAICVSPSALPVAETGDLVVATVCGFPSGAVKSEIKAAEAARAVADGAREVDMVVNVGVVKDGDWDAVEADVRAVVDSVAAAAKVAGLPEAGGDPEAATRGAAIVKVIIESAVLTDAEIVETCRRCEAAGAHYVKTSTGFHPSGGASAAAVRLMRETVGDRLGVKASGGIRSLAAAQEMLDAGASRLGLSGTAGILAELRG